MRNFQGRLKELSRQVRSRLSQGILGIVWRAVGGFSKARGAEAAASLAYYALFSMFPLLIVVVTAGSSVLGSEEVLHQIMRLFDQVIPVSHELIEDNLRRLLALREPMGVVGLVALLLSAAVYFTTLLRNINRAWSDAKRLNAIVRQLLALAAVIVLAALFILSILTTALVQIMPRLSTALSELNAALYDTASWAILSRLVSWALTFLTFLMFYRWVPNARVPWKAAAWGSLIATVAWHLAAQGFGWYLGSGLAGYELIYGSLATIITLLLWIYMSNFIILFGAHLSSAIAHTSEQGQTGRT